MPKREEVAEQPKAVAPKTEATKGTTVKKFLMVERAKKFFDTIDPAINNHIHQIAERVVEDEEKNKNTVCFVTFSTAGAKEEDLVDEVENTRIIKDILFAYHTTPEKIPSGKAIVLEVLPAKDDVPHILVVQEF